MPGTGARVERADRGQIRYHAQCMTGAVAWSPVRRIVFRFALVLAALLMYPFPLGMIPRTDAVASALAKLVEWPTYWFLDVLGLPQPYDGPNGSGDRAFDYAQLLLFAGVAALAAAGWSVVDRRRRAYPRLAAAARIALRHYLAWMMLYYGVSKVVKSQFYDIAPGVLHQRIGETAPMRLLWSFMGYSLAYTVFAGVVEVLGAVLLLWRRTTTAGALLVTVVMTNVVMLNLCYDVPVKLFSSQLLVMAVVIALPDLRRLAGVVLGRAAAEVSPPPPPRGSPRRERVRLVAKLAFLISAALSLYGSFGPRPAHDDHRHELYGNWIVDRFVRDGVEHPALTSDAVRWETWSAAPTYMQVWLMGGVIEGRTEFPDRGTYGIEVDPIAHTMTVTVDYEHKTTEVWRYARPAPDRLVIDCVHRGATLHIALHREPDGTLMTRGFHWINEAPFNR